MPIEYEGVSTASGDPCTLLRQLSKGALSSPRLLDPIIPRRTSSQPKGAQENKSKKQGNLQLETNPENCIWRNSLKELIRAAWYAEHTLYQLVTFEDRDRIQKQARVSEVLQSSATIKSWWVSDTFSIREKRK